MNKKPLISISVYKDVMIDIDDIEKIKKQISDILNTEIENLSIEVGYYDETKRI